jgi:hypothetical protein
MGTQLDQKLPEKEVLKQEEQIENTPVEETPTPAPEGSTKALDSYTVISRLKHLPLKHSSFHLLPVCRL